MKLSDYKLQHMGWKGNMTYDEMVSHLNRIQPRKTIQNQKDNIEDEIKAITKRSRKSENNDECPNDSEDENKTAMKRSRNSENNNECSNRSKDEKKTAMKRSRKSENNDECSNDSKDENKTAMKRSRKSENNDECSNDSEDGNKTAMKKSRKSENNDECPNTSKGLEGSCNEDSRFISDDIREMRKIKCKLCGEIVLGYTFDGHLGWKHKVTRQEYGSLDYINNVSYYRSVRDCLELRILLIRIKTNRNWNQTCDTFKKKHGDDSLSIKCIFRINPPTSKVEKVSKLCLIC
jgi:hypothetical protein